MKAAGLKVEVISSDIYKGIGVTGTSLTADHRAFMQDRVNQIAAMFQQHVSDMRDGLVDPEDMRGQVFMADAALAKGLVDEIVHCRDDVLEMM